MLFKIIDFGEMISLFEKIKIGANRRNIFSSEQKFLKGVVSSSNDWFSFGIVLFNYYYDIDYFAFKMYDVHIKKLKVKIKISKRNRSKIEAIIQYLIYETKKKKSSHIYNDLADMLLSVIS